MSMNMGLARKWAAVPGVTFPEPMKRLISDERCVTTRPAKSEWIAASELAKHLKVTSERANAVGVRADKSFKVYVDPLNPSVRTRYFRRSKVLNIDVAVSQRAADYEETHVPLPKAMELLGKGRNAVAKLVDQGRLHPVRVKGGGKRGIFYLYSKNEISKINNEKES